MPPYSVVSDSMRLRRRRFVELPRRLSFLPGAALLVTQHPLSLIRPAQDLASLGASVLIVLHTLTVFFILSAPSRVASSSSRLSSRKLGESLSYRTCSMESARLHQPTCDLSAQRICGTRLFYWFMLADGLAFTNAKERRSSMSMHLSHHDTIAPGRIDRVRYHSVFHLRRHHQEFYTVTMPHAYTVRHHDFVIVAVKFSTHPFHNYFHVLVLLSQDATRRRLWFYVVSHALLDRATTTSISNSLAVSESTVVLWFSLPCPIYPLPLLSNFSRVRDPDVDTTYPFLYHD
ncbi:hypothetical protein ONZ45_g17090 [Pleurotus djamor]|nr:hypothetical protein ONZ45_g17090 [Pleurotus djamor]